MPPEVAVPLDGVEEALLGTQAAAAGLTAEEYASRLLAAAIQKAAEDAVDVLEDGDYLEPGVGEP